MRTKKTPVLKVVDWNYDSLHAAPVVMKHYVVGKTYRSNPETPMFIYEINRNAKLVENCSELTNRRSRRLLLCEAGPINPNVWLVNMFRGCGNEYDDAILRQLKTYKMFVEWLRQQHQEPVAGRYSCGTTFLRVIREIPRRLWEGRVNEVIVGTLLDQ